MCLEGEVVRETDLLLLFERGVHLHVRIALLLAAWQWLAMCNFVRSRSPTRPLRGWTYLLIRPLSGWRVEVWMRCVSVCAGITAHILEMFELCGGV